MRVNSYGITDVGIRRSHNEDNFLIHDGISLFVVADGMGGHVGGEFASALAVTTIEEVLVRLDVHAMEAVSDPHHLKLEQAVKIAGRRIHQKGNEQNEYQGMGTTAVVVWIVEERAYIANVGDSRVYMLRDGSYRQVTRDHSLIAEKLQHGLITEEEAKNHRMRNVITRSLGYQEEVDVDPVRGTVEGRLEADGGARRPGAGARAPGDPGALARAAAPQQDGEDGQR